MSVHTAVLEQCQEWYAAQQYSKIIRELEPFASDSGDDATLELARAYLQVYEPTSVEGRAKLKALEHCLRQSLTSKEKDYTYNYRMGCINAFLDKYNDALQFFLKAIDLQPDDPDCMRVISDCFDKLTLPQFSLSFRDRVHLAWKAIDSKLLLMIADAKKSSYRFDEALEDSLQDLMKIAFDKVSFRVVEGSDKFSFHIYMCTDDEDFMDVLKAAYFMNQEPEHLRKTVTVSVGLPPNPEPDFSMLGQPVNNEDVQLWLEPSFNGKKFHIYAYCQKLEQFVETNQSDVEIALSYLVKSVMGTIPYAHHVSAFTLLTMPRDNKPILLNNLVDHLVSFGKKVTTDPEVFYKDCTTRYFANEFALSEEERAQAIEAIGDVFRVDIEQGNTRYPVLLQDYKYNSPESMDNLEKDGVTAGFIFFRFEGIPGDKPKLRGLLAADKLLEYLQISCPNAIKILGNAMGSEYCYLDLIAWDIQQVMLAATEFFQAMPEIPVAYYHSFRRDLPCIIIR